MHDIYHFIGGISDPTIDYQVFKGGATATFTGWQTWRKPRGAKMVYIIAVGGGSSGGCGLNTSTTSGGGAGGQSGAQTTVLIPAFCIPDVLYISPGNGGRQPATLVSAAAGVAGSNTYVMVEPNAASANVITLAFARGGSATGAATTTNGGAVGTAAAVTAKQNMYWATRGIYNFFAGATGSAGGASTAAGSNVTLPTTGLMVTGGSGGGGHNSTTSTFAGGNITGVGLSQYYPTLTGGIAGTGAAGGGQGSPGLFLPWKILTGGTGGGGAGTAAGLQAGGGGDGAPGCGGGGAGGSDTSSATLARPGNGGDGFVIIVTF